ncbi:MAG TPA: carboxymuconolactone decarboxylase family protein [Candidatus Eisenbacteria bacterium]|nr:carboxymuconolactone decarboxylase family protein [Candidatus Eisenbacteria bacterium]
MSDARDQAIARLSAAIAANAPEDVSREVETALHAGLSGAAVYETILQSYLFLGFPRAIEAFFAAKPHLERHGGIPAAPEPPSPAEWTARGESLCREIYGRHYEKLVDTMRGFSPDLAAWMILEGYGKTLSRPALTPVEREIGVLAILTVTRMWRQLRSHAIGTVNVGGTRAGARAAIVASRPWAGDDAVRDALETTGLTEG